MRQHCNRRPTKANKGVTPFELWFGTVPNNEYLRIFGCRAWYRTSEPKARFEPRGNPGIFVGYSSESKAYVIKYDKTNKLVVARDVVFDEQSSPMQGQYGKNENPKDWLIEVEVTEVDRINTEKIVPGMNMTGPAKPVMLSSFEVSESLEEPSLEVSSGESEEVFQSDPEIGSSSESLSPSLSRERETLQLRSKYLPQLDQVG